MYKVEKTWYSINYPCAVVMTRLGYRCGYVGVPETHSLFGVGYSKSTHKLIPYWEKVQSQRKVTVKCMQDNLGIINTFLFFAMENLKDILQN